MLGFSIFHGEKIQKNVTMVFPYLRSQKRLNFDEMSHFGELFIYNN